MPMPGVRLDMRRFLVPLRMLRRAVNLIVKIYWQGFGWVKSRHRWGFVGGFNLVAPI